MKKITLLFAAVALMLTGTSLQAGTILSENFNGLTPQASATSVGAFSAIGGTNVDIVGPGFFPSLVVAPESGNAIDMDGSGGNSQGILQSNSAVSLVPGVDYLLSFDLVGSQRGNTTSTTVTFGSYDQTFVLSSSDDTDGIVVDALVTVSTPESAFLTFTSNTSGDMGALLDNVSITSGTSASPVPEPTSLLMLGSGLVALAGFSRRKFAARNF
jgi:hypothetical protein